MKLGRYEILKELGRGAMGVVYLAQDPLIGRLVALKTLRASQALSGDELAQFRSRFIREAQSAGILSHPNIVTIHDVVEESEEGLTFIAMEYVEGTDLKELLRGGKPLELSFAAELVIQIAEALTYAHAKGVVHRDVKPANILITAEGQVKITDFGIARLAASNLTQDTQLVGTPNYMAPEQIQGRRVNHRSDIFSLGIVLYEMITGSKPFVGENLTEVTHRIVYEKIVPPSRRSKDLPAALDKILGRALDKEPSRRYRSARSFAEALKRVVEAHRKTEVLNDTQAVAAVPRSAARGSGDRGRRQRLAAFGAAVERAWKKLVAGLAAGSPGRPSRGRLLAVAGTALAVVSLIAALVFVWVSPKREREIESVDSTRVDARLRYIELVREGHRRFQNGDPVTAASLFRRAERLAPERLAVRQMREVAERAAEDSEKLNEVERLVARKLSEAQDALSAGRYGQAVSDALTVLELVPDNGEAQEILAAGQEGEERLEAQRRAAARRPTPTPQQEAEPVATPAISEPEEVVEVVEASGPPTLEIEFVSYYTREPVGTLTVWVGKDQLLQYPYRFRERRGPLGILGGEAYAGRVDNPPAEVPAGEHEIRVYVTPKGRAALAEIFSAELTPGAERKLVIELSEEGELTARLR